VAQVTSGNVGGPSQGASDGHKDKGTPAEHRIALWTRVVGVFTALLFLTSAVSDLFIFQQWRIAADTQRDIREQSRAYFGIGGPVQIQGAVDANNKPALGFFGQWVNLGSTRTQWAAGWISAQYFPDDVPYNFDVTRPNKQVSPQRTVVGPNQPLQTGPVGIASDQAAQLSAGKGVLVIWGHMEYADLFNPNVKHFSNFCDRMLPAGEQTNTATKVVTIFYSAQPLRIDCNNNK
jgi:hypothetical protein